MAEKLAAYRAKRDPQKTAEPFGEGALAASQRLRFVVQKHDATRLHYDFRLEHEGVMLSWAVTHEPLVGGAGGGSQANPLYLSLKSMQADKAAQVAALQMRRGQIQASVDQLSAKLAGDPQVAAEQGQIDRDYQVLKAQYDQLLAQRQQIALKGQAQTQNDAVRFSVIDPPTAGRTPVAPNRPLLLTGVLIAGLLAGVGAAFAMSQMRTTFPTLQRLEKAAGMPVIGSIGEMVTHLQMTERRRKLRMFAGSAGALGVAFVLLLGVEMLQRGLAA